MSLLEDFIKLFDADALLLVINFGRDKIKSIHDYKRYIEYINAYSADYTSVAAALPDKSLKDIELDYRVSNKYTYNKFCLEPISLLDATAYNRITLIGDNTEGSLYTIACHLNDYVDNILLIPDLIFNKSDDAEYYLRLFQQFQTLEVAHES